MKKNKEYFLKDKVIDVSSGEEVTLTEHYVQSIEKSSWATSKSPKDILFLTKKEAEKILKQLFNHLKKEHRLPWVYRGIPPAEGERGVQSRLEAFIGAQEIRDEMQSYRACLRYPDEGLSLNRLLVDVGLDERYLSLEVCKFDKKEQLKVLF